MADLTETLERLEKQVQELTNQIKQLEKSNKPEIPKNILRLEIDVEKVENETDTGWEWTTELYLHGKGFQKQVGYTSGCKDKAWLIAGYTGIKQASFYYKPEMKLQVVVPDDVIKTVLEQGFDEWDDEDLNDRTRHIIAVLHSFNEVEVLSE